MDQTSPKEPGKTSKKRLSLKPGKRSYAGSRGKEELRPGELTEEEERKKEEERYEREREQEKKSMHQAIISSPTFGPMEEELPKQSGWRSWFGSKKPLK